MLTDEEVLAIDQVLVRDNKKLTHIRRSEGMGGIGNTNKSPYEESELDYPISYFEGTRIFRLSGTRGFDIVAAVEDVLYLVEYSYETRKVIRLNLFECYSYSRGVAYDTEAVYSVMPVSHEKTGG